MNMLSDSRPIHDRPKGSMGFFEDPHQDRITALPQGHSENRKGNTLLHLIVCIPMPPTSTPASDLIGESKTPCIGYWMSLSMKTIAEKEGAMRHKITRYSIALP
jgi:hypothetical protein